MYTLASKFGANVYIILQFTLATTYTYTKLRFRRLFWDGSVPQLVQKLWHKTQMGRLLKPSRNEKGWKNFYLRQKWCPFLQLTAEIKTLILVQLEIFLGPIYFVRALIDKRICSSSPKYLGYSNQNLYCFMANLWILVAFLSLPSLSNQASILLNLFTLLISLVNIFQKSLSAN